MAGKTRLERVEGGVLAASGFRCGAVHCGLKSVSGALDLAILISDCDASGAGVFTRNRVVGAPVKVDRERLPASRVRGVVVNSGNSNACTGSAGLHDAVQMCALAARAAGAPAESLLVASTGIIGKMLPMAKVRRGIREAAARLGSSREHAEAFARAIMTTDTRPKQCAVRVNLSGGSVFVGGAAKGSGMIAPNMATMLCFITTDAAVGAGALHRMVRRAADVSFNCITVDGHCSTSDSLIVLANGVSGAHVRGSDDRQAFQDALNAVCIDLAQQVVRDGEGATRMVTIHVRGAPNDAQAKAVAMAIANSPLVKTAVHGGDPNWGRVVSAAGYAGVPFEENDIVLSICGVAAFKRGRPVSANVARLAEEMKKAEIVFDLFLGAGTGHATVWTCDLSREYITINADYHT